MPPKQVKSQDKKVQKASQDPLQEMQRLPNKKGLEIYSVSTNEFNRLRQSAQFAVDKGISENLPAIQIYCSKDFAQLLHHFINHLLLLVEKQDILKNPVSDLKTLANAYDILFYK